MKTKGRDREASIIRNANLACAAGRLLLGEITTWEEFLEPETVDYSSLPRKQLKSGKLDVQKNLKKIIDGFCKSNFHSMTPGKLVSLYEEIKAHRGLDIPYTEFSDKYSPVKGFHEKGYPEYSTVCISLWGLQYRFPEHDFSNDMIIAIEQLIKFDNELDEYRKKQHNQIVKSKNNISILIRKTESSKRHIMQTAFSLLECYLNGLAWSYFKKNSAELSKRKVNTLQDTSNVTLRDKIQKYPYIIFNEYIDESIYQFILDEAK